MKKFIVLVLVALLALSLASCASSSKNSPQKSDVGTSSATSLDRIKKAGVLVMGTSADFPPYESHQLVNGEDKIVGFDVDIAQAIADGLGVKLRIEDMKFDGLIAALQSGKIDMIVAGMTPTPERAKSVDFSDLYYNGKQVLVVKKDNKTIKSASDLKGKKLDAQLGTTSEKAARGIKGATVIPIDKVSTEVMEVKTGKVDGMVVEQTVAVAYLKENPDLKIVEIPELKSEEGAAIAVKKGDKALLDEINKILKQLKNSGEYDKLIDKWFRK
ncbi:basic amino acid ABC transporter substrate-binding protein [Caldanaerobius polysaccharolyticus]|uniref:basic amino acid ABC transporter substrate-binding protein n=1 Tax=Caldanaerobius polysaccharolyticus TaxID=44256 RepID=UPI00047ADE51|nr:basic amino acid ABC transporter substrate-binding protein [Caldanaerobius polysaccharolyticus]